MNSQTGSKRFCSNCGASISYDERYCPNCGTAISAQPQQQPQYQDTATSGPTAYTPSPAGSNHRNDKLSYMRGFC